MRFDVMPVATEKQIVEIEDAAKKVWHNYYKDIMSYEQIEYMLEKYQSKEAIYKQMSEGYIYYMLMSDNQLAGYLCVLIQSDCVYLSRLYIKAEYRRQGLARRTIEYIDKFFSSPGSNLSYIKKIRLNVRRKNSFAINVYEHLGFHKVKSVDLDIGGGFVCNDYIMERKIKRSSD
ncbi:MAG: GNAT family N-acetyltransferase [Clostridia bacterium]|nr:GNAT family N-acetyltransferase [Clostridia bacterium]